MVGKLSQVFFVDLEIQSLIYDTEVHCLKEKRNFANSQVFFLSVGGVYVGGRVILSYKSKVQFTKQEFALEYLGKLKAR